MATPTDARSALGVARKRNTATPRYALSVDVEDYFQVWAFSNVVKRASWDGYPLRADESTRRLLDLFDQYGAKGTFFVLGWFAERRPKVVREIVARGHEVASHGYDHVKVASQTLAQFREDASRAKKIIEDAAQAPVRGFRAAGFSIDSRALWAYDILRETGHAYSSSSHPIAHDHYGEKAAPRDATMIQGVIEAPVATVELFGQRLSCAGGGWFRATPYEIFRRLLARAGATLEGPAIFYLHPWEIDASQPRIASAALKSKARHYLNLEATERKLRRLLADFSWNRIDESLGLAEPVA